MLYKKTNYLTEDAKDIRFEVFVSEQGFQNEIDETDKHAVHIVIYQDAKAVGVCRYFPAQKGSDIYKLGRVAIRKANRTQHLGKYLLDAAEENILKDGGRKVILAAQIQAKGFYIKCGYKPRGEVFLEESCPHIRMEKVLKIADSNII